MANQRACWPFRGPDDQSEGMMINRRAWWSIGGHNDQSEGLMTIGQAHSLWSKRLGRSGTTFLLHFLGWSNIYLPKRIEKSTWEHLGGGINMCFSLRPVCQVFWLVRFWPLDSPTSGGLKGWDDPGQHFFCILWGCLTYIYPKELKNPLGSTLGGHGHVLFVKTFMSSFLAIETPKHDFFIPERY